MPTARVGRAWGAAFALVFFAASSRNATAAFQPGEFVTYSQDSWGAAAPSPGNPGQLLLDNFDTVYSSAGAMEVGINGAGGFSMLFTGASELLDYLPASGAPGTLSVDAVNPTSTNSGIFGGFVAALELDVAFNDAGVLTGTSPVRFGDLRLVNMSAIAIGAGTANFSAYDGLSVRDFLGAMNAHLGSGNGPYSDDEIAVLTDEVVRAFESGTPSPFAQAHLVVPEPSAAAVAGVGMLATLLTRRRRRLR